MELIDAESAGKTVGRDLVRTGAPRRGRTCPGVQARGHGHGGQGGAQRTRRRRRHCMRLRWRKRDILVPGRPARWALNDGRCGGDRLAHRPRYSALADQGPKPAATRSGRPVAPPIKDQKASLPIGIGDGGRALINCFAGCAPTDVVAAAGSISPTSCHPRNKGGPQRSPRRGRRYRRGGRASTRSSDSTRCAWPPRQVSGRWVYDLKGIRRVLYNLPALLAANADAPIFIVEGERDADNLMKLDLLATTNAGGVGVDCAMG